jgi:nitroreductase
MELYEGLLTRRSVRLFDPDKKVSRQDLNDILRAACYAPSAHNLQPWEFVVIEDDEKKAGFRSVQPWTSFAKNASYVIVVCGDTNQAFHREKEDERWDYADIDCALATQNLLLACHAKGIGACFCGASPMPMVIEGVKRYLNLPENIRPVAIVPIGYPLETPKQPPERLIPEKIHWEVW